jgi:hypothetical protein
MGRSESGDVVGVDFSTASVKVNGKELQDRNPFEKDRHFIETFGDRQFHLVLSRDATSEVDRYNTRDDEGSLIKFHHPSDRSYYRASRRRTSYLRIEREFSGELYTHLSWSVVPSSKKWPTLPKHPNVEHYNIWLSQDETALLVTDKVSQEVIARFNYEDATFSFVEIDESKRFRWVSFTEDNALTHFVERSSLFAIEEAAEDRARDLFICCSRYLSRSVYRRG